MRHGVAWQCDVALISDANAYRSIAAAARSDWLPSRLSVRRAAATTRKIDDQFHHARKPYEVALIGLTCTRINLATAAYI